MIDPYLAPSEYLEFHLVGSTDKTTRWSVTSRRSGDPLGEIKWYGPWRQYVFFPITGTIYNVGCMQDIIDRIETLMRWRANVRRNTGVTA